VNTKNYRNGRISYLLLVVVLGISLFGCNSSQSSQQQPPTPAEQQKLKDEQAKAQKEMNTLTSGMGQSLSKTPTPPTTDPAAEWKKTHPQKQHPTTKSQTQSQPAAPSSSTAKPQQ
jgi:peptidoglycan hydrolase CwlO-like protein